MKSLSSVGLGLSIIFVCLLLALVAELYYLLWWKKRFTRPEIQNDYTNPSARDLLFVFCCRNPSSSSSSPSPSSALNPKPTDIHQQESHPSNKDLLLQPFGGDNDHYLCHGFGNMGPGLMPRFLFTIIEETKEDLESEDGRSSRGENHSKIGSRGTSLSDLFINVESGATPYQTPLASPSLFTPPLTPLMEPYNKKEGYNPFFESSADAEFNKLIRSSSSSPPPRFKFLRDAEEKLCRRRLMESEEAERLRAKGIFQENGSDKFPAAKSRVVKNGEENGSFIRIVVDKGKGIGFDFRNGHYHHQQRAAVHFQSSTSSQVLPLSSSPSTFRSSAKTC